MYRRLTAEGRYVPARNRAPRSSRNASTLSLLDIGQRLRIDARRAAVLLDPSPCFPQDVTPVDAVEQRMKTAARLPLGHTPESALQLAHFVERLTSPGVVGTGRAGHALARACSADIAPAGTLRSARVIRRGPRHYYGPLGFPLRRARFRHGLYEPPCPDPGRADGPLVLRSPPCPRAAPPTPPSPPARASPTGTQQGVAFAAK